MTANADLVAIIPWLRRMASRYARPNGDELDDVDAYVSEAMLVAMRRYPDWDRERAPLQTFLWRPVQAACLAHSAAVRCRNVSIHAVSATECVAEWRTEPTADTETEAARERQRDEWRMQKAKRKLTERQRTVMGLRYQDGVTQLHAAEALGVSKQAISLVEGGAMKRLKDRRWQDCRGEKKRKRVCLWLDQTDVAALASDGVTLSVFAASPGGLTVSGGTDVATGVRIDTRLSTSAHERLRAAADTRGVSVSHLVRAKIRRELAHKRELETG